VTPGRAFVALGSNEGDRRRHLEGALRSIAAGAGLRVAAVSRAYENPAVGGPPQPDFWNAVVEVACDLPPRRALETLQLVETAHGRERTVPHGPRTLDLDLLAVGDERSDDAFLALPHPRAVERAFVLRPWAEIAPRLFVPGTGATVAEHEARLLARDPSAFDAVRPAAILAAGGPVEARTPKVPRLLRDQEALAAFRAATRGTVGFVPTMGALHEGHASLLRRARAECDVVVASVFVNPLQFGPREDLARYPRTLDADLDLLAREGADAVYVPAPEDVYPPGFSTTVDPSGAVGPSGPSAGLEGDVRPGHFRGVATVVAKLLLRVRPDRSYFGRKDAQQAAVVRRLVADLDLPGEVVVCETVRDVDGLALSSRNRFLSEAERARARALPEALRSARGLAARGERRGEALEGHVRTRLEAAGLAPDYVSLRDADTFEPRATLDETLLLVAAARAGATRLLDNEGLTPAGTT
jgi:pantoate--beta-alanine ligase